MLELQEAGCHNLNLVTPSHVVPQILEALLLAVGQGLSLAIVYNTSAYDSLETLRLLEGVVDIYMPDFKFWNSDAAARFLHARDYPAVARQALREMHRQVGALTVDERGLALRGVLVRHLVMPGHLDDTREIMGFLAEEVSRDTFVNLMDQYHPAWQAAREPRFAAINRSLEATEFQQAGSCAREAGLWRFD
jgi:putative pyruvate formate lyase activating enzyme